MNKYYAGIGSRETPLDILQMMKEIAIYLSEKGYILRSGGANGADSAFEEGSTEKQIFLPWKGFNKNNSSFYNIPEKAFEITSQFHPAWDNLTLPVRKLMARNAMQVLGPDLQTLSEFIVCWTKYGRYSGGTGQAIRIAEHYNIPVYNIKYKEDLEKMIEAELMPVK